MTWLHHHVKARGANIIVFAGTFTSAGAAAPTNTASTEGAGLACSFAVARTAVGNYTLTLAEPYVDVHFIDFRTVNSGSANSTQLLQPTSNSLSNLGRTITFRSSDNTGLAADITVGNIVQFLLVLRTRQYA